MLLKIQYFLKRLAETIHALIKIFLLSKYRSGIKYQKRTRSAVILLNGPSLTMLVENHLSFLKGKDLFCVNHFPLSDLYEKVKPDYFIISAPELWLEDVEKRYTENSKKTFRALNKKTDWPLKVLIPFAAKKSKFWYNEISKNQNIEIIYYNDTGIDGFQNIIFWFFRRKLAMPRPHNVLVPSLINAINLGYPSVYLWGAENNQFLDITVDDDNNALINQKHFYDWGKTRHKTMHQLGKGRRRIHEILHKFMLSFAAYHIIETYARHRSTRIINQTPGSLIDAFEREILT